MAASAIRRAEQAAIDYGLPRSEGDRRVAVTMRVPKMAELVASHLRRQIVRGELHEGDALPPETILMEQFGVSRPTLREAFRILESEALISVRRGARGGARVHPPNSDVAARYSGLVLEYRNTTLADVYEARSIIEPQCAGLLAARRTRGDLDRLYAAVESGEAVLEENPDLFIRIHTQFHALVVELAGNETLKVVTGIVRHIVDTANWNRVAEEPHGPSTRRATHRGARAHRRVVELIEAKDIEGAEALWRKHLVEADQYLLESPPGKSILDLLD
jgi:DNA-binding FadR family transcriptional regulator